MLPDWSFNINVDLKSWTSKCLHVQTFAILLFTSLSDSTWHLKMQSIYSSILCSYDKVSVSLRVSWDCLLNDGRFSYWHHTLCFNTLFLMHHLDNRLLLGILVVGLAGGLLSRRMGVNCSAFLFFCILSPLWISFSQSCQDLNYITFYCFTNLFLLCNLEKDFQQKITSADGTESLKPLSQRTPASQKWTTANWKLI